jgi:hypothetical protein
MDEFSHVLPLVALLFLLLVFMRLFGPDIDFSRLDYDEL